ncbi:MAG: hypothetical protein GX297_03365 [Treponema sp.]|nr:hypothetical protein [Treponema sp.]
MLVIIIATTICAQATIKTVYITNSGTKFHTENCGLISRAKNVTPIEESEALKKGYKPCSRCKP